MRFRRFELERYQSLHENDVAYNLSDSGVHPPRLDELLGEREWRDLRGLDLGYGHTRGTPELRSAISSEYRGAGAEHVLVTTGGAEANFLATLLACEPDATVVVMVPNYVQIGLLSESLGARVVPWRMDFDPDRTQWSASLQRLEDIVDDRTRLITLCNPNNPTGLRFDGGFLDAVTRIASRVGAWVLSDEIYRGSEHDGAVTETLWGRYERAIVTSSLSKAYGLPGLRLGWMVSTPEFVARAWALHDLTTIAPSAVSDRLATHVLSTPLRMRLLERGHAILDANWQIVEQMLAPLAGTARWSRPAAGAMAFVALPQHLDTRRLADRLLHDDDVLVAPGDFFDVPGFLRIGFGGPTEHLHEGLSRVVRRIERTPA